MTAIVAILIGTTFGLGIYNWIFGRVLLGQQKNLYWAVTEMLRREKVELRTMRRELAVILSKRMRSIPRRGGL